jgi:hypothetical protein
MDTARWKPDDGDRRLNIDGTFVGSVYDLFKGPLEKQAPELSTSRQSNDRFSLCEGSASLDPCNVLVAPGRSKARKDQIKVICDSVKFTALNPLPPIGGHYRISLIAPADFTARRASRSLMEPNPRNVPSCYVRGSLCLICIRVTRASRISSEVVIKIMTTTKQSM